VTAGRAWMATADLLDDSFAVARRIWQRYVTLS